MKNKTPKKDMARKMLTIKEKLAKTPLFFSDAWTDRKLKIEKRVKNIK